MVGLDGEAAEVGDGDPVGGFGEDPALLSFPSNVGIGEGEEERGTGEGFLGVEDERGGEIWRSD